eukprot:403355161
MRPSHPNLRKVATSKINFNSEYDMINEEQESKEDSFSNSSLKSRYQSSQKLKQRSPSSYDQQSQTNQQKINHQHQSPTHQSSFILKNNIKNYQSDNLKINESTRPLSQFGKFKNKSKTLKQLQSDLNQNSITFTQDANEADDVLKNDKNCLDQPFQQQEGQSQIYQNQEQHLQDLQKDQQQDQPINANKDQNGQLQISFKDQWEETKTLRHLGSQYAQQNTNQEVNQNTNNQIDSKIQQSNLNYLIEIEEEIVNFDSQINSNTNKDVVKHQTDNIQQQSEQVDKLNINEANKLTFSQVEDNNAHSHQTISKQINQEKQYQEYINKSCRIIESNESNQNQNNVNNQNIKNLINLSQKMRNNVDNNVSSRNMNMKSSTLNIGIEDDVGDGFQKLASASDQGIASMIFAAKALMTNTKTNQTTNQIKLFGAQEESNSKSQVQNQNNQSNNLNNNITNMDYFASDQLNQEQVDKKESKLFLRTRNDKLGMKLQQSTASTSLGISSGFGEFKPRSPSIMLQEEQDYNMQKQKFEFPEEELSEMPKDARIYYRYVQKIQKEDIHRQKSIEQRKKQQLAFLSMSASPTERNQLKRNSINNSFQSNIMQRKNSKVSQSTFTVDDFGGDLWAFKQAQAYQRRLAGQEMERLKSIESREKIKYILFLCLTIFLNVLNLFACCTFIVEDYISYSNCDEIVVPNESQTQQEIDEENYTQADCSSLGLEVIDRLELTFSLIFLIEMFYNYTQQARPKYQFFYKKDTIIDLLTIVPPIINLILENKIKIGFLRILRLLKVMRVVRIFKMLKKADTKINDSNQTNAKPGISLSPIQNQVIILMLNIFTTVFIAAGIIMFIDNVVPQSFSSSMRFVDAIYYMIITSGTIGYGDFYPISTISRMTIIIIIVMIITVFGNQISALAAIIKEADFYDTQYHLKGHVIVLGTEKVSLLTKFLLNLYKSQEENPNPPQCIIIGESRISPKIKRILNYHLFEDRVHYLSVKSIDQGALKKGCFYDASAIFYLSDQFSFNSDSSDKKALFINQFLINNNIRCNMYIELCVTDQQSFMRMRRIEDKWQVQGAQNKSNIQKNQANISSISNTQNNTFINNNHNQIVPQNTKQNNQLNLLEAHFANQLIKYQVQNVVYINLVKTKFQILAFSLFNEGVIQLFSNWFLNDHELLNQSSFHSQRKKAQFSQLIDTASIYQQQLDYKLYLIDFPICFIGKTFESVLKIFNNINHGYKGRYIVKSLLIGIKRCQARLPSYSKTGQPLPFNVNLTQRQLQNNKLGAEYPSIWHLNQDVPQFSYGSKSYIINSPKTMILYGDKALVLASCDDVIRFYNDKNANEILQYEFFDPFSSARQQQLIEGLSSSSKKNSTMNLSQKVHPLQQQNLNQLNFELGIPQQTHFDTQASHRNLISERDVSSNMQYEANHNNNNLSIKGGSPPSTIQPNETASKFSTSNILKMQTLTLKHEQSDLTQDMGESCSFSSTSQEFNNESSSSSDYGQLLNEHQAGPRNKLGHFNSNKSGIINLNNKLQKDMQYKKILQDKTSKIDTFLMKSMNHQMTKLFDYRCSLNQQGKIVDLSQTNVNKQIGNHIIIYGGQKHGLEFFVEEIRKLSDVPLCIFSQSEEMEEQFCRMTAKFNNIFFFRGNVLNIRHMRNANVKQAQAIVVLSYKSPEFPFGDCQSVIVTQFIRGLYPQKKIITEIIDISRLPLLEQQIQEEIRNEVDLNFSNFLSKELMSGRIFFSQQLDSMAQNRSTEPHLTNVFLKIVGQETIIQDQNEDETILDMPNPKAGNINGGQDTANIDEKSTLMSLRIPQFMEGQDYWQLFDEMAELKGFIFLGLYTKNFNVKEYNENQAIFKDLKHDFEQTLLDSDKDQFGQRRKSNINQKTKFSKGVGFVSQKRTKKEQDDWFDLDVSAISNTLPLLILNPPMGTKLMAGDFILALGSVCKDHLIQHLQDKKGKISKKNKSKKKLTLLLQRQQPFIDKEVLKSLTKEFTERVDLLQDNIELLKECNKEIAESIQATLQDS